MTAWLCSRILLTVCSARHGGEGSAYSASTSAHCLFSCRRVNGKAVREGGYEVQASFGPLAAAHCCVLGGDVGAVVCGGATDFHVAPHDAHVTGRKVPHQDALSVTVTGAVHVRVLNGDAVTIRQVVV